ncbi:MAG: hypothetical protein M5U16_05480 [Hyphomicrobium sp.]|nr:hypothetical protein [Hyphomicrobium sp.]
MQDIEHIIAHLPEDLDARFAGVDHKLAGIREVLALHTTRFTTLERKVELGFGETMGEIKTIRGEVDELSRDIRDLRQLIEERLPKT